MSNDERELGLGDSETWRFGTWKLGDLETRGEDEGGTLGMK